MMGVPVLNNSIPIARARDKLRALQLLSRFGIDIPRTVMCRYRDEVPLAVEQVGGLPCIMKLIQGTQGVGVLIASSMSEVEGMLDTLWTLGQEILLQELIAESRGKDVRALVVGDRVVAAMRRTAREGEFRSNIHRGGEGQALELPLEYAAAAVKAARVIGLEVAGVDMLESREGPKIMEVNSSPGFEGLERVSGVDIGGPFTDIVLRGDDGAVLTGKLSSTPDDYGRAIVDGLAAVCARNGVPRSAVSEIVHGTTIGSFAAAIVSHLALGQSLPDAIKMAQRYVAGAIRHAPGLGQGQGPINHFWALY
jgi:RimK family alpha-L-glutamate ligase